MTRALALWLLGAWALLLVALENLRRRREEKRKRQQATKIFDLRDVDRIRRSSGS